MFKPTIKGRDLRLNVIYIILCDLWMPTKKIPQEINPTTIQV